MDNSELKMYNYMDKLFDVFQRDDKIGYSNFKTNWNKPDVSLLHCVLNYTDLTFYLFDSSRARVLSYQIDFSQELNLVVDLASLNPESIIDVHSLEERINASIFETPVFKNSQLGVTTRKAEAKIPN